MALKKEEILKEIKEGRVKIEPYNQEMVKDASIELTLGSPLGIFGELKDFKGEPIIIAPISLLLVLSNHSLLKKPNTNLPQMKG